MKNINDVSHALRLRPNDDLRMSVENFVNEHKIEAGWVVTCVGSLVCYTIRFANQYVPASAKGHFEIVSLSGTI
jgi:uncharacterized protein